MFRGIGTGPPSWRIHLGTLAYARAFEHGRATARYSCERVFRVVQPESLVSERKLWGRRTMSVPSFGSC